MRASIAASEPRSRSTAAWFRWYSVATAWMFAALTACQLAAAAPSVGLGHGYLRHATIANLIINAMFTGAYTGTLLFYLRLPHKTPSRTYTLGVALYTAGYLLFAAHFGCRLHRPATVAARLLVGPATVAGLFALGSGLFLAGSVLLVWATAPSGSQPPWRSDAAPLFCGSALFLLGSALFVSEALGAFGPSRHLGAWGLAAFLPGRVLFLQAEYSAGETARSSLPSEGNDDVQLELLDHADHARSTAVRTP